MTNKERQRVWYKKHREQKIKLSKEYSHKKWRESPEYRDRHKETHKKWIKENKDKAYKYTKNYNIKNPIKNKARVAVHRAIRIGNIIKPIICSHCKKSGIIQAHHPDHTKPLEIIWLCISCHHNLGLLE